MNQHKKKSKTFQNQQCLNCVLNWVLICICLTVCPFITKEKILNKPPADN